MRALTVSSPAKVNLVLYVMGRRADGYHNLVTLFHRISLCDTLRLKKSRGFHLRCSNPSVPRGKGNLITRAYRLLQKKFPDLGGVSVHLTKRIPLGGGLGGGSSNAAAFLLGMKRLYRLKISRDGLVKMGKRLGADVPFFLYEVNQAIGKGRGDRILPRPVRHRRWFLLILSDKGLSTKKVYARLAPRPRAVSLTKRGHAARMTRFLHNDLEAPAFQLRPSIQTPIRALRKLGADAGMSGSGPTVFAIFSKENEAAWFAQKLRPRLPKGTKIKICHSV